MATAYTSLLGLALPVTGELQGTWGDEVNNYITQYVDSAVAGTQTISGSQTSVTLSTTTNAALTQAGSGSTGSAQYQIINCTGNPASALTVDVPKASKVYLVINATSTNQAVTVRGGPTSPTTGVTVAASRAALIAWNGSDFRLIASTDVSQLSGVLGVANGGTGLSSGTSGGIPYFSSTSTIASSAALAANALVIGGGAGVAPATTTTGTGVLTAVGNAVNTSGGLVTQSGTLAASSVLLGGGASTAISSTTTGTGVVTAIGNAVNTSSGLVTQTATLTSNALLLGGGSGVGIASTTTGTGVVTAVGNAVNTSGGLVTQSGTLASSAILLGGGSGTAISSTTTGTGVVTALGNNTNATGGFPTTDGTATLTNKRVNPRVVAAGATSGNLTINGDTTDLYRAEGLTGAITFLQPSGTPVDGQKLMIRLEDNGTGRGITWTTTSGAFRAIGVTLPTTTVASKTTYVGCVYNSTDVFWDVVATVTQA